ncbi:MAG: HesB/IscA family protein [Gammaproteobacteria bacterium]
MQPIITITERAAVRIKDLIAHPEKLASVHQARLEKISAVRVTLANRGCSGKSYEVEYADDPKQNDEVIEQKGVKIYIDPAATMFLIGTEMDWVEDKFSSSFQFKNPNEKARCGCGESFMV